MSEKKNTNIEPIGNPLNPKNVLVTIGDPFKRKYVEQAVTDNIKCDMSWVKWGNNDFVLYKIVNAKRDGFKFMENLASEFGKNGETLFWNAGESDDNFWFWDDVVNSLKKEEP